VRDGLALRADQVEVGRGHRDGQGQLVAGIDDYIREGVCGKREMSPMRNLRDRSTQEPGLLRRSATPRLCLFAAAVFGAIALVTTQSAVGARDKATRDHKPPTTPTGLSVTSSTATSVSLSWSRSRDNIGVAGYKLYVNSVQVGTTSGTSYTLTGLICGSSYTVGVSAYDGAGNTSVRATAVVSTNPCYDVMPPSAPSGVTQTAASDTSATLSWTRSTDNVGVVGYGAYLGIIRVGQTGQTTYTFTGLRCGQTTVVGLDAVDAAGNRSTQTMFSVTTGACVDTQPPSAPSGVTETSDTESTISLSWTASADNVGVAYYKIYSNGAAAGTTPQTSYTVSGLACGTSYTVAVEAYDAAGSHSSQATATLATSACPQVPSSGADTQPPTVPGSLAVQSSTQSSVTLSWNPSTDNVGVVGYGAYQSAVPVGHTAQLNFTFTGLSCGTSSAFGIDAYDAAGNRSAQASVIASTSPCPDMQAPSQPTGLALTSRTTSSLSFTWAASTDNIGVVGYGVYTAGTRVGTASSAMYTVTGLACGTSHTIGVDAYDAAGNRSTQAIVTMATSPCPDTQSPSAPTNLSPSGATQTSLTLSWAASSDNVGVAGYNIYANSTEVASTTGTSYTVNNLTCGTSYTLAVETYDGAGNRSPQASVSASTSACPASVSSCTGVNIGPTTDLAQTVTANPSGTTFCISTGVHRLASQVDVKPGDRFIGAPGAILSGGRVLTNWSKSGSVWSVGGQTEENHGNGVCATAHLLCNNMNDVFFDGTPLSPVSSVSAVGPGMFFFDYPNDTIYIGDDPNGHQVEVAVGKRAFSGCNSPPCGPNLLIKGLIMEHFYSSAVEITDGTVSNNETRFNHVAGIAVARDGTIDRNYIHDNGLEGLASTGDKPRRNLLVDGNETAHNGWYAGYNMGWEGGGGKWLFVNGLTLTNNNSHDNNGSGFWADTDNINVLIANNQIRNNAAEGIEYEASFAATIRDNTITGNGFGIVADGAQDIWFNGAGITITESPDVQVYGNTVQDNHRGIGAVQQQLRTSPLGLGVPQVKNLDVHDNTIRTQNKAAGLIEVVYDSSYYTSKNNRFQHNTYTLSCTQPTPFAWQDPSGGSYYAYITRDQWVGYGRDTTASFSTYC
jgi:parallel beta-helix repeat protein